ncbi:MAG: cation diffusion facilitator family transporter, partial [Verrucomicrobia bacterium]|nr:cation diffusion facilitator family transporter [Verrucomicrobiota bacterium]
PGRIALIGAFVSIVLKEWLYRWTMAVGKRMKSPAVIANAWHHRSDALSSIPALAAVGVAVIAPRFAFLDHVGALIVSLFIIKVSWDIMAPALADLADRGGSDRERDQIAAIAISIQGVQSLHALRSRRVGSGLYVDLHLLVNGRMSVSHGHAISEQVKKAILEKGPDVLDVVVHLEPVEDGPESI